LNGESNYEARETPMEWFSLSRNQIAAMFNGLPQSSLDAIATRDG
jgi:hypothetical protein